MSSPITSVSQSQGPLLGAYHSDYQTPNSLISLSVRGRHFDILREDLTSLPESILLCLFPNGLLLDDHEDSVVNVDFDPDTLGYVLDFFRSAIDNPPSPNSHNPALQQGKSAIIVLKEDLDFYIIPPPNASTRETSALRLAAGNYLISNASIFEGLRKQHSSTPNTHHATPLNSSSHTHKAASSSSSSTGTAEQHLIDMLCASGFDANDTWTKRYIEPQKACITSLALAMLRQGDSPAGTATSQKLLLFWRKPARKCWWDAVTPESLRIDVGADVDGDATRIGSRADTTDAVHNAPRDVTGVKIWARRVWTLELSITG